MKLRCVLFGCEYKDIEAKTENGIFTIRGNCVHCGKEAILVQQPYEELEKILHIPSIH